MAGGSRVRTAAASVFAVAFTGSLVLLGDLAGSVGDSDATFVEHFASGSQRGSDIAGSVLLVVAAVAFVYFTALLALVGSAASNQPTTLAFVRAVGMLAGVGMLIAALAFLTVPLSISLGEFYDEPGGAFSQGQAVLPQFGTAALAVGAMVPAGATIVAVSRLGLLPRWFARVSAAVGVLLMLTSLAVATMVLLPLWVAAAAGALRRTAHDEQVGLRSR